MKFMYSAPCFSGDCGFCASCCDAEDDSSESEIIRRAEDLSKFFGPKKIDKITMNYNSSQTQIPVFHNTIFSILLAI